MISTYIYICKYVLHACDPISQGTAAGDLLVGFRELELTQDDDVGEDGGEDLEGEERPSESVSTVYFIQTRKSPEIVQSSFHVCS